MTDGEPITPPNPNNNPTPEQLVIQGHISALKEFMKDKSKRDLIKPMMLDFGCEEEEVGEQEDRTDQRNEAEAVAKGKDTAEDVELAKPFKSLSNCPLTARLIQFSAPNARIPTQMKLYDGKGDPEDHITRFKGMGNQNEWPMPVWCRVFQQTLDDRARAWFDNLPRGSIDTWDDLEEKFRKRFGMLKKCAKDPTEITKIVRRAHEGIAEFKERWISEANAIPDVPELMRITSFMGAHKCPELAKRFSEAIPRTEDEMLTRVTDYIKAEEVFRNTELPKGEFVKGGSSQTNPGYERPTGAHGGRRRREGRSYQRQTPYATPYVAPYVAPHRPAIPNNQLAIQGRAAPGRILTLDLLRCTPEQILATEHHLKLPPPPPMKGRPSKELENRFCNYHGANGHYTDDCHLLRSQLEVALESGKLNHLMKDMRLRIKGGNQKGGPPKNKVINMIAGHREPKRRRDNPREEDWMNVDITFPPLTEMEMSDDPIIIEAEVEGFLVRRILVDNGASVEIMFEHCFNQLTKEMKARLVKTNKTVQGFSGERVSPIGKIEMEVLFGYAGRIRRVPLVFTVVAIQSPYNIILGRPGIRTLRAIPSSIHAAMRFPTPGGIATLVTASTVINECREMSKTQEGESDPTTEDPRVNLTEEVMINPAFPDQLVTIAGNLSPEGTHQLKELLKNNLDIFAWEPSDMTGVPRSIAQHTLNVSDKINPRRQKRRVLSEEKSAAVQKEVAEWLRAGIVRPVKYPTWIANPVLVKKGDGTWRMCIDFKNLNTACPKDYYPLPEIDSKVEAIMGYKYKCFLDAYKGYHQIQMAVEDEESTAFYTEQGTYCYTKMPFGLKNAGATYQRLIDATFQGQIGRNLEAYVDDMVIKSRTEKEMIADIAETFDNLRRINMKLNPKKCSFGVSEGKFLGYMVTSEGIRANPEKTKDVVDMRSPKTWGEMQSLAGKLAALNRFLSKSAERSLPFFETLKNITKMNKEEYRWTEEAERAFQELKEIIVNLPTLTTPKPKEDLYVYLAACQGAVSAVLLAERNSVQRPIRYVSKTLHDAERNYSPLEKLAFALLTTSRKLRRHFEGHNIVVITDQPLKQVLSKAEASGRMARYSVELGAYTIRYAPRTSVKSQILADFINEIPTDVDPTMEQEYHPEDIADRKGMWTLFTDGASGPKGSGAGLVLINPSGVEFTYAFRLKFESTNNAAEYEALLAGMRMALKLGVCRLSVKVDSKLVACQLNGEYVANHESMIKYLAKAKEMREKFKEFSIENIPRNKNQKADVLSKLASVAFDHLMKEIMVEILEHPSTDEAEVNTIVEEEGTNWMTPILNCLEKGEWPEDPKEARTLRMKISNYTMEEGVLFKKGYLMPLLRCVGPLQASYVIREIHMGICGMHMKPRSIVAKAIRQGYYWPTMHEDARKVLYNCKPCVKHSSVPKLPKTLMTSIMAPWPFFQWGIDMLGPLPDAPGKVRYVIVAVDYFTKWIEAKPLAKTTGKEVIKFVWESIVCRFGLPRTIVSDNGTNFVNDPFKNWCERHGIRQMNTAVAHPQANDLVERANKSLMEGIKTRLSQEKSGWVNQLQNVLWAFRTMIKTSHGETPFSLTYGGEAVIPAEIGMPTHRTLVVKSIEENEEELRLNLDLLQERREAAAIREARYKRKMEQYYNKRVKPTSFQVGELVFRKNEASRKKSLGKLGPNWEGPYEVRGVCKNGSYKLYTMAGKEVPRMWHSINLRKNHL